MRLPVSIAESLPVLSCHPRSNLTRHRHEGALTRLILELTRIHETHPGHSIALSGREYFGPGRGQIPRRPTVPPTRTT
jgi:hypothetical protein